MKTVYATAVFDMPHRGHIEFLKKARALGDRLVVGLHPDDVCVQYKRKPIMPYEDRKRILQSLKEVNEVTMDCMDFREPAMLGNLKEHKVNILVHGDDWLPPLYEKAKKEGYEVKQVPCWPEVTTTKILAAIRTRPNFQRKDKLMVVSAGDAITAKLIEQAGFDGIWISGFEATARLGLVDNGTVTMTEMLNVTKPIVEATNLPVIVDVDNGFGGIHNFIRCVQEFEKINAAGICVEDNVFPKVNSLWGGKVQLLSMEEHGAKVRAGKEYQKSNEFMIIARTEALIRGYGKREAFKRAEHYADCGADMILMHSREKTGKEAFDVVRAWKSRSKYREVPLVIVPTKFPQIKNKELFDAGYKVVILANQMERTKIRAIKEALREVKKHDCVLPLEKEFSATLDDMRALTPMKEAEEIDEKYKY